MARLGPVQGPSNKVIPEVPRISNGIVATGCNWDILGINKACKGWFQVHGLVNIRATLHILKWRSQLGGRTILIQDEAGCEATSVPGVSCSDL